jgi:hypothetical protein
MVGDYSGWKKEIGAYGVVRQAGSLSKWSEGQHECDKLAAFRTLPWAPVVHKEKVLKRGTPTEGCSSMISKQFAKKILVAAVSPKIL